MRKIIFCLITLLAFAMVFPVAAHAQENIKLKNKIFIPQEENIYKSLFSDTGKEVIVLTASKSDSDHYYLYYYDIETGRQLKKYDIGYCFSGNVYISNSRKFLVKHNYEISRGSLSLDVYSLPEFKLVKTIKTEREEGGSYVKKIKFSADDKYLLFNLTSDPFDEIANINLFNLDTLNIEKTFVVKPSIYNDTQLEIGDFFISPDNKKLICAEFWYMYYCENLIAIDIATGKELYRADCGRTEWLNGTGDLINIRFNLIKNIMVLEPYNRCNFAAFDMNTGKRLYTVLPPRDKNGMLGVLKTVSFSNDGERIIASYGDKALRIWDINTGTIIKTIWGSDALQWHDMAKNDSIAIIYYPRSCEIWNIEKETQTYLPEDKISYIEELDENNKYIIAYDQSFFSYNPDNTIFIFDVSSLIPQNNQPITVKINGRKLFMDTLPVTMNGKTYMYYDTLLKGIGAQASFDESSDTLIIKKGTCIIEWQVNSQIAIINGTQITTQESPQVVNGKIVIPVRFVVESLGDKVTWDNNSKTIYIQSTDVNQNTDN